jgi:hypothetical protein
MIESWKEERRKFCEDTRMRIKKGRHRKIDLENYIWKTCKT